MSTTVWFECDGCDAKAEGVRPLRREFIGTHGSWGIGVARWKDSPASVSPIGWVASDPYTYCTYCPECADSIGIDSDAITATEEARNV